MSLTGVVLGALLDPWWFALGGFVGAGLVLAGPSGWCGMASLLARNALEPLGRPLCGRWGRADRLTPGADMLAPHGPV